MVIFTIIAKLFDSARHKYRVFIFMDYRGIFTVQEKFVIQRWPSFEAARSAFADERFCLSRPWLNVIVADNSVGVLRNPSMGKSFSQSEPGRAL